MANLLIFPASLARSVASSVAAAAVGGKGQAGCMSLSAGLGASCRLRIRSGGTIAVDVVLPGTLPASNGIIAVPTYSSLATLANASIGSGWVARIGRPDDAAYVEGPVGLPGSGAPFILSANPSTSKGFALSLLTLQFDPTLDGVVSGGGFTLAEEYALAMSELNDFEPGNLQSSSWPESAQFQDSPWGSNVDQMVTSGSTPSGVQEGRVIPLGANRVLGWCWFMPRKNLLTPVGNWRIEFGRVQMAVKVDSLSNGWNRYFGPITPDPGYGTLSNGSRMLSGNVTDSANTTAIRPFEDNSPLDARTESSQTVSIRNVGTAPDRFQCEINVPDGDPEVSSLPANATSDRVYAFAGCFWARLIPHTPGTAITPDVEIGALMGLDCYGDPVQFPPYGRVGNPGWGRLRKLTTDWKPIVMAFVRNPNDLRYPMSRAQIAAWLPANPPPFS